MDNYFTELNKLAWEVEKKNWMNYISWSDAWTLVKEQHADSTYTIYENSDWNPFWETKFGIDCKVWVTINWIEHVMRLPVMDWANKSMRFESYVYKTKYWDKTCEWATQFDINKTIMRAFTKAIAMHWIWMYVYRWEDFPEEQEVHPEDNNPWKPIEKVGWEERTCTKCFKENKHAVVKEWKYWPYFVCEHCSGFSKAN